MICTILYQFMVNGCAPCCQNVISPIQVMTTALSLYQQHTLTVNKCNVMFLCTPCFLPQHCNSCSNSPAHFPFVILQVKSVTIQLGLQESTWQIMIGQYLEKVDNIRYRQTEKDCGRKQERGVYNMNG